MPVHDWTRVDAGIFHDFHNVWVVAVRRALNDGLLPKGYYALTEQHAGRYIADVLTLHAEPNEHPQADVDLGAGGIAVADAPPRVHRRQTIEPSILARRRSLAIRHVSGHRLVALVEVVSPGNKDRVRHVEEFANKAVNALDAHVHLLMVDLFPPSKHDPHGMHHEIQQRLSGSSEDVYDLPSAEPLTLASYSAGPQIEMFLEHFAVGSPLSNMPLFLTPDRYVNVPLEQTYQEAYSEVPEFWREVLEGSRG